MYKRDTHVTQSVQRHILLINSHRCAGLQAVGEGISWSVRRLASEIRGHVSAYMVSISAAAMSVITSSPL